MRVVAGTARGRRLVAPAGSTTRPTADRVREAVFNALHSLGAVEGADVLDAFAGSGALGIEALSRGAERATFVEVDGRARQALATNLDATGLADRATVVAGEALAHLAAPGGRYDLVLLDPPYAFDAWSSLLTSVTARLAPEGVVVIESDRPVETGPSVQVVRVKHYGSTVVAFARLSSGPAVDAGDQP